jgi:hypothetical protein
MHSNIANITLRLLVTWVREKRITWSQEGYHQVKSVLLSRNKALTQRDPGGEAPGARGQSPRTYTGAIVEQYV